MTDLPPDPFGTAGLRARVLEAWAASPARFREDANAEEDLALGGYRDRLVVELAQNASDAAARAGVAGRLLLRLEGARLHAANTGAPLDAEGVAALSSLRASAKRGAEDAVGRFGVGFAAVRAVADEVAAFSRTGGVAWSRTAARSAVAALPELAEELGRRQGDVPVLRLPYPAVGVLPEGYDTEVVLALRDAPAVALVREMLHEIDAALLLALPGLDEVVVVAGTEGDRPPARRVLRAERAQGTVVVRDDGASTRWLLAAAPGRLDAALLHDRPTEERSRPVWSVLWAVPVDAAGAPMGVPGSVRRVVHAPTPTAEPLDLPALLIASFPLDSTRRSVAPGRLRDALVAWSAQLYGTLVTGLAGDARVLALVPGPVPAGELDARLREAVLAVLAETPFVSGARGERLRPRDAVLVEGAGEELVAVLAELVPGLVAPAWARPRGVLTRLGARRLELADVIDALADLDREPAWWRGLYATLAGADREALGALPVPLADGRLVRGPRGILLPGPGLPPGLEVLGLRVAHPDAAHPLLERLGAVPATPASVLADPGVRAGVLAAGDDLDGPADDGASAGGTALADVVLALVAASGVSTEQEPWLADLTLRDAEGEPAAARDLVLPGSPLAALLDPDALDPVAPELVERFGAPVLAAVGVLSTFALVREPDVPVDPHAPAHDLDDEDAYYAGLLDLLPPADLPPTLAELVAVRDLDYVRDEAWAEALRLLAKPPLRAAVTEPALVRLGARTARVPPYTAWWLRRHARLDGRAPGGLRDPEGDPLLAGLYDDAPPLGVDAAFAAALGVRTSLAALLEEPGGADDLLARLADPARPVGGDQLRALYRALARLDPDAVEPPERLRVPGHGVVPAADVLVLDAPDLAPFLAGSPVLAVPADLSEPLASVLGLDLASEAVPAPVTSRGEEQAVPAAVRRVLPSAPGTWMEHGSLIAGGREVDWRVVGGLVHAATLDGMARGLAWRAGAWERRLLVGAVLAEPERAEELLAEAELDR